jgi:hypothetical protein
MAASRQHEQHTLLGPSRSKHACSGERQADDPPLLTLGSDVLAQIAEYMPATERSRLRAVCRTWRDAVDGARIDVQFSPCMLQQLQYLEAVDGHGHSSILKALRRSPKAQALIAFGSYCCAWVPRLVSAADEAQDAGERAQALELLFHAFASKLQWQCGGPDMDKDEGYSVLTARVQFVAEVRKPSGWPE